MDEEIIKKMPLNDSKVAELKRLVRKSFRDENFLRKIFSVKTVDESSKETEFFKVGVNEILDRGWLVDDSKLNASWGTDSMATNYGLSIARVELKEIIRKIVSKENIETISFSGDLIEKISEKLNKIHFDTIITDFDGSRNFYDTGSDLKEDREWSHRIGIWKEKVVFYHDSVPKGTTILLNSKSFGEILTKSELKIRIFEKLDKEKIIKQLPQLADEDFDLKINILIEETVGFKFLNNESCLILKKNE
ncbi:hypothetical protein HYT55_02970 [Candidatus Woesearchaeota archaeon]|nr:hypothetical protein [Candidatus Woesearchaeota archaeon]